MNDNLKKRIEEIKRTLSNWKLTLRDINEDIEIAKNAKVQLDHIEALQRVQAIAMEEISHREELIIYLSTEDIPTTKKDNITDILEEREQQHGRFLDNSITSQHFKYIARDNPQWEMLGVVEKEAIDNILQKISRYISGNNHLDTLLDIQGYTQLIIDSLEE